MEIGKHYKPGPLSTLGSLFSSVCQPTPGTRLGSLHGGQTESQEQGLQWTMTASCDCGQRGQMAGEWGQRVGCWQGRKLEEILKHQNRLRVLDIICSLHKYFLFSPPKYLEFRDARVIPCLSGAQSVRGGVATAVCWVHPGFWGAGKAEMKTKGCGVVGRFVRTAEGAPGNLHFLKPTPCGFEATVVLACW